MRGERGDALEFWDVLVLPDAEIAWGDAGFRADGVGLGDDEAGAANGAASEVHEVPIVGKTVDRGVFAHGGDGDSVGKSEAAELEGSEEVVGWMSHNPLDVVGGIWMWWEGESAVWTKFSCSVLEGVLAKVADFWWFFCGVDVVKCVVNVEKEQRCFGR